MANRSLFETPDWGWFMPVDTTGLPSGISPYLRKRRRFYTDAKWDSMVDAIRKTKTVYVGNMTFQTAEEQIYELFGRIGLVKNVIMGLNKVSREPCGFCFVEYFNCEDAVAAKKYLNGTKLDDRFIAVDVDPGFEEGRQYGRSKTTGGQVRDGIAEVEDEARTPASPVDLRRLGRDDHVPDDAGAFTFFPLGTGLVKKRKT